MSIQSPVKKPRKPAYSDGFCEDVLTSGWGMALPVISGSTIVIAVTCIGFSPHETASKNVSTGIPPESTTPSAQAEGMVVGKCCAWPCGIATQLFSR
jgi:hypothetical protein